VGDRPRPTWPELSAWLHGRRRGRTAALMGIRANESLIRRRAVANYKEHPYVIPIDKRVDKVYPVYDWDTTDVWTAPRIHGWDHNEAYDRMEMAGVAPHQQRCAPPFGEESQAGLWEWAVCFPDIWEKLCDRVPGAATAARYSRTKLYSYTGPPDKPDDVTWPDFIRQVINSRDDDNDRRLVAQRVKSYVSRHYLYTSDPILVNPHPRTAVCWPFLLHIAYKGDIKARQSMHMTYPQTQQEADAYYEELARFKKTGMTA
jgi:predicted phosphoadenosine phosphosulfate sulfurtransferase